MSDCLWLEMKMYGILCAQKRLARGKKCEASGQIGGRWIKQLTPQDAPTYTMSIEQWAPRATATTKTGTAEKMATLMNNIVFVEFWKFITRQEKNWLQRKQRTEWHGDEAFKFISRGFVSFFCWLFPISHFPDVLPFIMNVKFYLL